MHGHTCVMVRRSRSRIKSGSIRACELQGLLRYVEALGKVNLQGTKRITQVNCIMSYDELSTMLRSIYAILAPVHWFVSYVEFCF